MSTSKCSHLTAGESGGSQPTGWPGWVVSDNLSPLEVENRVKLLLVQMRAIAQHLADSDYDLVLLQVDRIYLGNNGKEISKQFDIVDVLLNDMNLRRCGFLQILNTSAK